MVQQKLVHRLWLRMLVLAAYALWQGGFVFYTGIVVPTGTAILGSAASQGFITQQVTNWLNVVGIVTLLFLLGNLVLTGQAGGFVRGLLVTWFALLCGQLALFALHGLLDGLLEPEYQVVKEPLSFRFWHRIYLHVSTLIWLLGLVHLGFVLRGWRRLDQGMSINSGCGSGTRAVE